MPQCEALYEVLDNRFRVPGFRVREFREFRVPGFRGSGFGVPGFRGPGNCQILHRASCGVAALPCLLIEFPKERVHRLGCLSRQHSTDFRIRGFDAWGVANEVRIRILALPLTGEHLWLRIGSGAEAGVHKRAEDTPLRAQELRVSLHRQAPRQIIEHCDVLALQLGSKPSPICLLQGRSGRDRSGSLP